jgi:acyl-[acyl-carrier-protein] desaturase
MRGWTAEENRHGDLLNAYLRLTGRVDMRSVEITIHNLISGGFDPRSRKDPYAGLIYTSFQERATKISHANVGRLAVRNGDENLARICQKIAGDESRHEQFYTRMMGEVMDRDPERGVLVFRDMMRHLISMPGRLMSDGQDPDLFDRFASVAQRLEVYTVHDYADVVRHLVSRWNVAERKLSGSAASAQEFLCLLADRLESVAENVTKKVSREPPTRFSWINNRMA